MPITLDVTAGWTYTTGDTATASNLNALGLPTVKLADDETHIVAVGSLSAPGIAFNGDTNTGWAQLAGADSISGVAGGTEVVRITSTQVGFINGTNAAPSITFIGDGNTGINHDSGDEIDVVCGGSVVGTFGTTGLTVAGAVNATSMAVSGVSVLTAGINTSQFVYYTDFTGPLAATGLSSSVVATGAVAQITSRSTDTDHRGLISLTVAAVSDRAVVHLPAQIKVGGRYRIRMQLAQLSTPSERFFLMLGLTNNTTDTISSATGNGAWFQYVDSASAQWQTITMNVGVKETQTTDITVAAGGTWYTLELYRAGASDYRFYVNGVLKTTHVTSVASGIDYNFFVCIMEKTVGSGSAGVYLDSVEIVNPLTRT